MVKRLLIGGSILLAAACSRPSEPASSGQTAPAAANISGDADSYQAQIDFLKQHTSVVELTGAGGQSRIAVCPQYQGRVMTATLEGPTGRGLGWINRNFIAAGKTDLHFNNYGGADRFWLGPEGGQFALFFKPGDPYDIAHWFTPPAFNEGAFPVSRQSEREIAFHQPLSVTNHSGTRFSLETDRVISMQGNAEVERLLGLRLASGVSVVAYASDNQITNTGTAPWTREAGLVSIWILGMFRSSPDTTVIVPFIAGPEATLGPIVNDAYFGKIPADRLAVHDGYLLFRADGKHRSKLGISRKRAKSVAGSYDATHRILTVVQFTLPPDARRYVNSMWEDQKEPYGGDVVNSYNDGPQEAGGPSFGAFYELESSSPAAALAPSQNLRHVHRTFHFTGTPEQLDAIARAVFGVALDQLTTGFRLQASGVRE
ncbi:MAG: DUF6786 family protein [Acidobacteriota bacterium]